MSTVQFIESNRFLSKNYWKNKNITYYQTYKSKQYSDNNEIREFFWNCISTIKLQPSLKMYTLVDCTKNKYFVLIKAVVNLRQLFYQFAGMSSLNLKNGPHFRCKSIFAYNKRTIR